MLDIAAPHLQTDRQMGGFLNRMIEEKNEGVVYRIVEQEDEHIPELVLSGEIELGICNTVVNDRKLAYEEAFIEEIVLITPNQKRYRNLESRQLRNLLLEEGHIRFDFGAGSDFLWNDFFGRIIGIKLHDISAVARCSNYNLVLQAVAEGNGIAGKPYYVVYNRERAESPEVLQHVKDILVAELNKSIEIPDNSFLLFKKQIGQYLFSDDKIV